LPLETVMTVTALNDLSCVIMAGGAGTRFWPASTEDKPKQLLTLIGDRSLLQLAVDRAIACVPAERVLVVTSRRLHDAVRAQLPELPARNVIAEPERKDTAAATALATLAVQARGGRKLCILTADHLIGPTELFVAAVTRAAAACEDTDAIVTFGVVPTHPATGFGYLEVERIDGDEARPVKRFVEKPDLATASAYVASGRFLWNSGMFVFETAAMLAALHTHLPSHLTTLGDVVAKAVDGVIDDHALAAAFAALPRISIDKGVMEKHHNVRCVPARFAWSDVGSFPSLAEHLPTDPAGNAVRGHLRSLDAHNNVVWCEDAGDEVAIVGLSDVVVVRAGQRTLVVPRNRAEDIKKLFEH
jgi:mannose-1-phosphate guanylyltransferase